MKTLHVFLIATFFIYALAVSAQDLLGERPKIANTCLACHGANGISPNEMWPNLAGQKRGYLIKSLKDYRDGGRYDPLMSNISKLLNDKDIEDLASYYSRLGVARPSQ